MNKLIGHLYRIGFYFVGVIVSIAILYLVEPGNITDRKPDFTLLWIGSTTLVGLILVRPKKPILQVVAGSLVSAFIFFLPFLVILVFGFPQQD